MNQQRPNKRAAGSAGMKALIATASVAATIAGWAMLPANDPAAAGATSATNQLDQPPALSVPGGDSSQLPSTGDQSAPSITDPQLPQVQVPNGSSRFPFTRTHSSR